MLFKIAEQKHYHQIKQNKLFVVLMKTYFMFKLVKYKLQKSSANVAKLFDKNQAALPQIY